MSASPASAATLTAPIEEPALRFSALDAASPAGLEGWLTLWRRWPGRETSAHPEYARLFARSCDRVVCLAGEGAGGGILFPVILRPLSAEPWAAPDERRWDAVSPYGYGGPFAWGGAALAHRAFWRAHAEWCVRERVVSTFARLSLFPEHLAPLPERVEVRAPNIAIPLDGDEETLRSGYATRVRRWIKVAQAAGVRVEQDATGRLLDGFLAVYEHTMRRHDAEGWYYFPRPFFEAMLAHLGDQVTFFHALVGDQVISSDLVLCSAENVYYFLGGTLTDAFPLGPNYLLKHTVATWAQRAGKRRYVLGGGYQPGDGVFRYKRGWARHGELPFRVACLEHDAAACRELLAHRSAHEGPEWAPREGFFPAYRG